MNAHMPACACTPEGARHCTFLWIHTWPLQTPQIPPPSPPPSAAITSTGSLPVRSCLEPCGKHSSAAFIRLQHQKQPLLLEKICVTVVMIDIRDEMREGQGAVSFCVMVPAAIKAAMWGQQHPHGAPVKVPIKPAQP